jgi:hypothetical protein
LGLSGSVFIGAPRSAPGLARADRASASFAHPDISWGGFEPSGESRRVPTRASRLTACPTPLSRSSRQEVAPGQGDEFLDQHLCRPPAGRRLIASTRRGGRTLTVSDATVREWLGRVARRAGD